MIPRRTTEPMTGASMSATNSLFMTPAIGESKNPRATSRTLPACRSCYLAVMADAAGPMPWWKIIAILVVVALVAGAIIGLLGSLLGFSTTWAGVGVGAALGVVAATLI